MVKFVALDKLNTNSATKKRSECPSASDDEGNVRGIVGGSMAQLQLGGGRKGWWVNWGQGQRGAMWAVVKSRR